MQVREAHVDRPEFLESFRGRLNQSWSIERNVGLAVTLYSTLQMKAVTDSICRETQTSCRLLIAMWGRG
jgi:hypothetical protein